MEVKGVSRTVANAYAADNVSFEVANPEADRMSTSLDTSDISRNTGLEIYGLIGATTLGQLKTNIDYRDGLVNFE
jgi:hypothetical protein